MNPPPAWPGRSASSGPGCSGRPSGSGCAPAASTSCSPTPRPPTYGAGRPDDGGAEPALIVVAVPPDLVSRVVADELAAHPAAVVTDVASVKGAPLAELQEAGLDLSR